jgi:hypothetical protein
VTIGGATNASDNFISDRAFALAPLDGKHFDGQTALARQFVEPLMGIAKRILDSRSLQMFANARPAFANPSCANCSRRRRQSNFSSRRSLW